MVNHDVCTCLPRLLIIFVGMLPYLYDCVRAFRGKGTVLTSTLPLSAVWRPLLACASFNAGLLIPTSWFVWSHHYVFNHVIEPAIPLLPKFIFYVFCGAIVGVTTAGVFALSVFGLVCGYDWLVDNGYWCKLFGHQTEWVYKYRANGEVVRCHHCCKRAAVGKYAQNPITILPMPKWDEPTSFLCRLINHNFKRIAASNYIECKWCKLRKTIKERCS